VLTDSEGEPKPPSELDPTLSPGWDEIIRLALAREPAHRYQTADEFLNAITQLEQPTDVADLPLPQLRTLGIGIVVFAGLVFALVASPAFDRFRQVAPATAPWQRLHIAPPRFATAKTPVFAETPPRPKVVVVQHAKRVAPAELTAPVAAAPAPVIAPVASVAPEVDEPVAPDAPEPAVAQDAPPPAKKGFWSKLNVFKKKNADAKEKQ
jgi:hypothetical protein